MDVFNKNQIEKALNIPELILEIEKGFVAFSEGKVVVPSVGHMNFDDPLTKEQLTLTNLFSNR